jgi:hypothetical protein
MFRSKLAAALVVVACSVVPAAQALADDADPSTAEFEGHTIELSDGSWDGARACATDGVETRCFANELELNAWLAAGTPAPGGSIGSSFRPASISGMLSEALTCSTSLRLYEHGGFGGRILYLASRALWFNLANYGFSNITSSFRVGACSSYLADYSNGGGSWYPGSGAWASVPVMINAWNDRISSIYLV